ncbi:MAG: hypothetical protein KBT21_09080 [Treponema sp.]|nr:hypothetical protein [Candidatus Treponema merdequi]
MKLTSNFRNPLPGENATYYCIHCKKSFSAKVPDEGIIDIFRKITNQRRVKCPDCKKPCGLDPRIRY